MASDQQWHALEIGQVFRRLGSSQEGLTAQEAAERLEKHGPNEIALEDGVNPLAILWDQIVNPLVLVLIVAMAISLISGHTTDAIVIIGVIVLNTAIGFSQEYQAERALAALKERAAPEAKVLRRDGSSEDDDPVSIRATQVVPGDILVLETGDKIAADARLLEAINLSVDESMLTGESVAVEKQTVPLDAGAAVADRLNMAFAGTVITRGRGRAIAIATGHETQIGQIATLIKETEKGESPLQIQIRELGKWLGILAAVVSTLTFVIGLLRGFTLHNIFFLSLASAVSSIPEGLPAVMTITLAIGVNRMAKRHAIIRRLRAVDTLGAATVICSDKTGTLTTNEMTVQQIHVGDEVFQVTGAGFAPEGQFLLDQEPIGIADRASLGLALRIGALCNDSQLGQNADQQGDQWRVRGDPTEGALVVAAAKGGLRKRDLEAETRRVDEIPFDSLQKYMVTFHQEPASEEMRVYAKGAPETIVDMCSAAVMSAGAHGPLDREAIMRANEKMASAGLRVLALAYQVIRPKHKDGFKLRLGQDSPLVFAGLVGMMDPPRPEVKESVHLCKQAGIKVIMATGDHQLTAKAIAQALDILQEGDRVLTGADLDHMTDDELDALVNDVPVFARVSPEHKHRLVESLRRQGHVVAMTGDGVNDAPALQSAEIGVAMGIAGTDVAKETADMVLTDDNFSSIVNAVEEGRAVFQNVRKVVKFLLATNIGEDLTIISSLILFPLGRAIITPVQILWVNLVTDGLLDITIAMEPKEGDVMNEPPRRQGEPIINKEIVFNMIYVALFMAVGVLGTFFWLDPGKGFAHAQTIAFTTMAMFQVFNALNCRSRTKSVFQLGLFANKPLLGAIVVSVLLQVSATKAPFLRNLLGTQELVLQDWLIIIGVASSVFVADEVRKLLIRRKRNRGGGESATKPKPSPATISP